MRPRLALALRVAAATGFVVLLGLGLLGGGLELAPRIGVAAPERLEEPRRPPVLPPALPADAPEESALWTYLYRIAPIWDSDRPTVIRFLEQFLARYPGNETATEKLYAAYLEDGKERARASDADGARARFQQAADLDPRRGEALELLEEP